MSEDDRGLLVSVTNLSIAFETSKLKGLRCQMVLGALIGSIGAFARVSNVARGISGQPS
jgi:hypothetical protein